MKFIIGIGNPDRRYDGTRHNIGFAVLDCLASTKKARFKRQRFEATIASIDIGGERLLLIKPLTYVNKSGRIVAPLITTYGSFENNLLVVCDDIDLPLGILRIRKKGSSGGHNGLKSIIDALGTSEFDRLRIGIGRRTGVDAADYVLDNFTKQEQKIIQPAINNVCEAIEVWATVGIEQAMNRFNNKEGKSETL